MSQEERENLQDGIVADPVKKHKKKKPQELIKIPLPPPPKDVCRIFDPVIDDDCRLATASTICCWLPMGCFPSIIGCFGIYYAVKARRTKNEEQKALYAKRSQTISWLGMILFMTVLTIGIFIIATSGIL